MLDLKYIILVSSRLLNVITVKEFGEKAGISAAGPLAFYHFRPTSVMVNTNFYHINTTA
jgi:hypothetical protein